MFIGINGIYNWSAKNDSTDKMLGLLKEDGHEVYDYYYPPSTVISNFFKRGKYDAKKLVEICGKDDTVFAFSRGGLVVREAIKLGLKCKNIVLFGVAAPNDKDFSKGLNNVYNIYHPHDFWVRLGSFIPFHPFGTLGIEPAKDKNIKNIDASQINKQVSSTVHSDYWEDENIQQWKKFLEDIA